MWKALVVDDNFVNRKLLVELLRDRAVCDVAANGVEAIEAYNLAVKNGAQYDIIYLDIAMPELDGLEVLRLIRENEQRAGIPLDKGVPVMVVTAHKEPFSDSFRDGCDAFMMKPLDPYEFLEKSSQLVEKKREQVNNQGGRNDQA